jgi:hypothetical protein
MQHIPPGALRRDGATECIGMRHCFFITQKLRASRLHKNEKGEEREQDGSFYHVKSEWANEIVR